MTKPLAPEKRIRRIIQPWVKTLGLELWDIDIELAPTDSIGDAAEGFAAVAECGASWEYERATIRFETDYVNACNDTALERLIVHELMHIVLNEMRDGDKRHKQEEHTAVVLTRAFIKAKLAA